MFLNFPPIEGFDRVMAYKAYTAQNLPDRHADTFALRPKIKLHGSNGAIGINKDGVWVQGRNNIMTPQINPDKALGPMTEMAHLFFEARKHYLTVQEPGMSMVVFGEWAGMGIQRKDAVTKIPKTFFPFMLALVPADYDPTAADRRYEYRKVAVITDPEQISAALSFKHPSMRVLPWAGPAMSFSYSDQAVTERALERVNARAEEAGVIDPYIKAQFGIEGPGEGYVYVPDTTWGPSVTMEDYGDLTFKAKAARHRVKATAKAATVKAEIPENAKAFVETFVTETRLEQMLKEAVGGVFDKTKTGLFVRAVVNDVMKESAIEREELGVEDKVLTGLVSKAASTWFLEKIEGPALDEDGPGQP